MLEVLKEFGWLLLMLVIVKIWCVGCIICLQFFDEIISVFMVMFDVENLIMMFVFLGMVKEVLLLFCCVVVVVVIVGLLVLVFFLVFFYFDSYCQVCGMVNFIQVQCDFFGVYGFDCFDGKDFYYGLWGSGLNE